MNYWLKQDLRVVSACQHASIEGNGGHEWETPDEMSIRHFNKVSSKYDDSKQQKVQSKTKKLSTIHYNSNFKNSQCPFFVVFKFFDALLKRKAL